MDDHLKNALDFAKYNQTLNVQKKFIKEKNDARLTVGENGGLFKIDRDLLNFVDMLYNNKRTSNVVLLDINQTPILIDNLVEFKDRIFSLYFETTLEYFAEYQKLKSSRSVEKLIS
jgi:hypothetical protein